MEYPEQVRIISDIERSVPVHLITYRGIQVWPVVRLIIWQHIFDGAPRLNSPKKKSPLKRGSQFLRRIFAKKNTYQHADAVFLVAPHERRALVNGAYFSPFSNSTQEVLQKLNIRSVMLDLDKKKLPVYGETYFVDQENVDSPIRYKISRAFQRYVTRTRHIVSHWDSLLAYMQTRCPQYIPAQSDVIAYCEQMIRYENIFLRILRKITPKVAFLVCYYHPAAMGYIKACRMLGIQTVEIQHGDLYGMYRHWINLPPKGYELLPSTFWCWGKESADKIHEWSAPVYPEHRAFIGGNPWIARFIHTSTPDQRKKEPGTTTNVLVALTSVPYPVDAIVAAIRKSPHTVRWIIRPHPAMRDFANVFAGTGAHVVIESSPHLSLFELLQRVDFMITPCSTVAYEALELKVHPIITHKDGLEKFRPNIEKGLFSYAESGDSILEVLRTDRSHFTFHEESPYMETDEKKIRDTLLGLLRT